MSSTSTPPTQPRSTQPGWYQAAQCHLPDFIEVVSEQTNLADYPHAARVDQNVLVYECAELACLVENPEKRRAVQAELVDALLHGPGVFVMKQAFTDHSIVDRVSDAFRAIIDEQHQRGTQAGDHFAKPGANDRIWNALEKLALLDPRAFANYYANDMLALAATAWLGPDYQMTSQVNQVNPGGAAQMAHVDYHLGFQSNDVSEQYPPHVHALSPVMTLQGAVAHVDMPLESGPTLYLPHSQKYPMGYLAWRNPEFRAYFDANHIQLPLTKGDAVFFNPALFHAAGQNRSTDIRRMGNLLQVCSAFTRALEAVDRDAVVNAVYPALLAMQAAGVSERSLANAVASAADGYPFPTNLDRDQPIGGLAPESHTQITMRHLRASSPAEVLAADLAAYRSRRQ